METKINLSMKKFSENSGKKQQSLLTGVVFNRKPFRERKQEREFFFSLNPLSERWSKRGSFSEIILKRGSQENSFIL